MKIKKKIRCLHCRKTLECNDTSCVLVCECGKVSIHGDVITEGTIGKDYIDVSPKLLID